MVSIILIILAISAFTLVGSWYARRFERADALIALYVIFTALSQIMASKIAVFDLGVASFTAPAAVLIFAGALRKRNAPLKKKPQNESLDNMS
jgi:formate-dependent nitrite reductase membrane component NrfD